MNSGDTHLEARLREAARALSYPPTPDLAARVLRQQQIGRRLPLRLLPIAAGLIIAVLLFAAVPEIRAGVLRLLRIGALEIVQVEPTVPAASVTPTTPVTPATNDPRLDFPGETTLDAAQQGFGRPIPLPTYPPDLGAPSRVFAFMRTVALVWLDADGRFRLGLHLIPSELYGEKITPWNPVETDVNGQPALWLTGEHDFGLYADGEFFARTIGGGVLIWAQAGITYRLESDLPLDETRRIAESLR